MLWQAGYRSYSSIFMEATAPLFWGTDVKIREENEFVGDICVHFSRLASWLFFFSSVFLSLLSHVCGPFDVVVFVSVVFVLPPLS